jgi:hypothetical protein
MQIDIGVIKERLGWHRGVGWGIATAFVAVLGWLITMQLPNELKTTSDNTKSAIAVDIARLEGKINNLTSLQTGAPVASALEKVFPAYEKNAALNPSVLVQRFKQAQNVVEIGFANSAPANPVQIGLVKLKIQSALDSHSLSPSLRDSGVTALVYVDAYGTFSREAIRGGRRPLISELTWDGAPIPSSEKQVEIVYDVNLENTVQDITYINWVNVGFKNVVVKYNGGPLYLGNVTFKDCTFEFGNDNVSQALLRKLKAVGDHPASVLMANNYSSLSGH